MKNNQRSALIVLIPAALLVLVVAPVFIGISAFFSSNVLSAGTWEDDPKTGNALFTKNSHQQ